jgi:hypothetical protein
MRCLNCPSTCTRGGCYYTGHEKTPRGKGYCAWHDGSGKVRKGKYGKMYVSNKGRWKKGGKISSPRGILADNAVDEVLTDEKDIEIKNWVKVIVDDCERNNIPGCSIPFIERVHWYIKTYIKNDRDFEIFRVLINEIGFHEATNYFDNKILYLQYINNDLGADDVIRQIIYFSQPQPPAMTMQRDDEAFFEGEWDDDQ